MAAANPITPDFIFASKAPTISRGLPGNAPAGPSES
jgi:hypothetical protein